MATKAQQNQKPPVISSAKQRFVMMSHRKLRRIANGVRGKNAMEAVAILRFMPHFSAKIILRNLIAAIHNAKIKMGEGFTPEALFVNFISIDEGPAYRRFKPRAQGRIYQIQKPTAHVQLELGFKQ
jgi:large subunit ribosomal protein L22